MRKPRVAVILIKRRTHFIQQLRILFGDYIDFYDYFLEEAIDSYIHCDLALVPSYEVAGLAKKYLMPKTEILVVRRTISKKAWGLIQQIPANTKILVVNTYREVAVQTVAMLYELGCFQFELIPFDPNKAVSQEIADIEYAITPNDLTLVPNYIKHVINIGDRLLDISTLYELLNKLNLVNKTTKELLFFHIKDMMPISAGFVSMFSHFFDTKESFETLLDMVDYCVLSFDAEHRVKIYNRQAADLFWHKSILENETLESLFVDASCRFILEEEEFKDEVFNFQGAEYLVNKNLLMKKGAIEGGILTIRKCEVIEHQTLKIHQVNAKGHVAKYTFEDVSGNDFTIKKAILLAKKAASTDNDILIEGESGVGKELFAHAIHQYSNRSQEPFVAFNCAAISEALLESELFGYEEGAFTGANRKGKKGMFEIANQGTIFLDEIAEISKQTQVKLLRVLQERELIRVGGTQIIPINVRVITATNQNLFELVSKKEFRMDLYFRLNVFNLKIPSLRERVSDIPFLIKRFFEENQVNIDVPYEVMQLLLGYTWPGNVRELRNCINYMIGLGEEISFHSLPFQIQQYYCDEKKNTSYKRVSEDEQWENREILLLLYDAYREKKYIGRKELAEKLLAKKIFLSEQSVRTRLKKLSEQGMVRMQQGRAGTKIMEKGIRMLMI